MPLYHVQDSDRPLYVVAKDFGDAVKKWQHVIYNENGPFDEGENNNPQGVYLICDDDELVIYEAIVGVWPSNAD